MLKVIAVIALAAPLVQSLLMGVIGYPLAKRRPGGMETFRQSGFTWWIIAIAVICAIAAGVQPALFAFMAPSAHEASPVRFFAIFAIGTAIAVAVDVVTERLAGLSMSESARRHERERYEGALPAWVHGQVAEMGMLSVVAVLEEGVYRAVALGALLGAWGFEKPLASGIVCVAFGLAHWYYGVRQVLIKMIVASVFVWMALSAGWVVAALGHALMNVILTYISAHKTVPVASGTSRA